MDMIMSKSDIEHKWDSEEVENEILSMLK
jgi:hypothetical protein